jgi:DNA-binding XRE family transcriptional regulator
VAWFALLSMTGPRGVTYSSNRADKLERLGRLVCGPLWQSELARTLGVSRQTILRWAAGEFHPSPQHTAEAKRLVRARVRELEGLLKEL